MQSGWILLRLNCYRNKNMFNLLVFQCIGVCVHKSVHPTANTKCELIVAASSACPKFNLKVHTLALGYGQAAVV